jgi:hypothetical protein
MMCGRTVCGVGVGCGVGVQSPDSVLMEFLQSSYGERVFPAVKRALQQRKEESLVYQNAIRLLTDLPTHSHLRRSLLSYLATGLSVKRAAEIFEVSRSWVRAALDDEFEPDDTNLFLRYTPGVRRLKITDMEETFIQEIIKDLCPVRCATPPPDHSLHDEAKLMVVWWCWCVAGQAVRRRPTCSAWAT